MTATEKTPILVADDHPLFRAALVGALAELRPDVVAIEADSFPALEKAAESHPEAAMALLDLNMPGARGFSSLVYLRAQHPAIPVIVVSASEDPNTVRRARDFGAAGFIPKSASIQTITAAIEAVDQGEEWFPSNLAEADDRSATELSERLGTLTPQQFRVLLMLADGKLNKQIAFDLNVSEATVKAHMTAILRKLNIYSRTQAALIAKQLEVNVEGANPDG